MLCACGCGQETNLAKKTRAKQGQFKGQPVRYVLGHSRRGKSWTQTQREAIPKALVGLRPSPETRAKQSIAKKGRPLPASTIQKMRGRVISTEHRWKLSLSLRGRKRPDITGPLNKNWNGGGQDERTSVEHTRWSLAVKRRDRYTCQRCGLKSKEMDAHHIWPFAEYPAKRYDLDNGVTLCRPCHRRNKWTAPTSLLDICPSNAAR